MQVVYPTPGGLQKGHRWGTKEFEAPEMDATLLGDDCQRESARGGAWLDGRAGRRALRAVENGGVSDGDQPPVTCIGMFESGRGDLSERASRDEFEPQPFR